MSRALITINGDIDRKKAANWAWSAPRGCRIEFKAAQRTTDQNARMWAMLTDVATQVEHLGRRYTPDQWKVLFMHACGREVQFLPALDGATFIPWGRAGTWFKRDDGYDVLSLSVHPSNPSACSTK